MKRNNGEKIRFRVTQWQAKRDDFIDRKDVTTLDGERMEEKMNSHMSKRLRRVCIMECIANIIGIIVIIVHTIENYLEPYTLVLLPILGINIATVYCVRRAVASHDGMEKEKVAQCDRSSFRPHHQPTSSIMSVSSISSHTNPPAQTSQTSIQKQRKNMNNIQLLVPYVAGKCIQVVVLIPSVGTLTVHAYSLIPRTNNMEMFTETVVTHYGLLLGTLTLFLYTITSIIGCTLVITVCVTWCVAMYQTSNASLSYHQRCTFVGLPRVPSVTPSRNHFGLSVSDQIPRKCFPVSMPISSSQTPDVGRKLSTVQEKHMSNSDVVSGKTSCESMFDVML